MPFFWSFSKIVIQLSTCVGALKALCIKFPTQVMPARIKAINGGSRSPKAPEDDLIFLKKFYSITTPITSEIFSDFSRLNRARFTKIRSHFGLTTPAHVHRRNAHKSNKTSCVSIFRTGVFHSLLLLNIYQGPFSLWHGTTQSSTTNFSSHVQFRLGWCCLIFVDWEQMDQLIKVEGIVRGRSLNSV